MLEIIAAGDKVCGEGGGVEKGVDVFADDMTPGANVTERCILGTSLGDNTGDSARQGFDRAEPGGTRGMIDGGTAFSILLVV